MTAAGQFIAELHQERRRVKVSSETELHLKHVAVGEEIDRLDREAATLRKLCAAMVGELPELSQG